MHIHTYSTLNQDEAGAMLLSYSRQVASAMVYLSMKGYIHRDLAGRNILLSMDGVCKVNIIILFVRIPVIGLRLIHCTCTGIDEPMEEG